MVTKAPGAHGRVTDVGSHASVVNASVCFPGRSPVTLTDKDGKYDLPYTQKLGIIVLLPFEFQNVPLLVTHPDYLSTKIRVFTMVKHGHYDIDLRAKP